MGLGFTKEQIAAAVKAESEYPGNVYAGVAPLPAAAPQQPATITLQRALATGTSPDVLRAAANWNERKSYDERRRKARARHKAQAVALRAVADELEMRAHMRGAYLEAA